MMALRRSIIANNFKEAFTKCEQTGNPVMFNTNLAKGMKITVPSAQSGTPAKIAVSGMNIWDEEYEAKVINSDGTLSTADRVCSKNFIPVVAGTTYVMIWPKSINRGRGAYYDENFDLVQYKSDFPDEMLGVGSYQYGSFTVPAGAHYLKFCTNASYHSTYNNNISLNYPPFEVMYHAYTGQKYSVTVPSNNDVQAISGANLVQNDLDADMTVEFLCENPKENSLTVMSYNLQYFNGLNGDTEMQEDILEEYNPSVVAMQEFRADKIVSPKEAPFSSKYWNIFIGNERLPTAFATNYGLSNVTAHSFTNQVSGEDKGYVTAEMKFKGKTIFLVSVHLTAADETYKVLQAAELYSLVQTKETFILMGDFNTSTCTSTSATQYTNMIKQFVDAGYNVANCSEQHGFKYTWYQQSTTSSGLKEPDDNIITSADFTMTNVRTDTIKVEAAGSQSKKIDHVALICELTL